MSMKKINFQNGVTPVSAGTFNEFQNNIDAMFNGDNAMGNIVVDDIECKNIFDGVLDEGTYDENGEKIVASNYYRNVNIIEVKPNTTYTASINGVAQKYVLYFYDASKNFIKSNSSTNGTFTTDENTYYVNFRCYSADFTSNFRSLKIQLEKGPIATNCVEHKEYGHNKPTVLFENITGSSATTITLNDNVNNYDYIEVYAKEMAGRSIYTKLAKLGSFENRIFPMNALVFDLTSRAYFVRGCCYTLSGNTITKDREAFLDTSGVWNSTTNIIHLQKVVGHKVNSSTSVATSNEVIAASLEE